MARSTPHMAAYWDRFWTTNCAYNPNHKISWHLEAQGRLRDLAKELGLSDRSFDIRSNMGGPAVSGEVTLHAEELYVQVSQSSGGQAHGILFRTCQGRKDYTGGPNNFAHILELNDLQQLAHRCDHVMGKLEPVS